MLKIISVIRNSGEYEGKPYENFNFFCVEDIKDENVICGFRPKKFKNQYFLKVRSRDVLEKYSLDYLKGCAGYYLHADFNEYGNVSRLIIKKDPINEV